MNRHKLWILLSCLLLVSPALVLAQTASVDSPSDQTACSPDGNVPPGVAGKRMNVSVKRQSAPMVRTDDMGGIGLADCDTGAAVAKMATDATCVAARLKGYVCTGIIGITPCDVAPDCCADSLIGDTVTVNCLHAASGNRGFTLSRLADDEKFSVAKYGPGKLTAVSSNTNAGNTLGSDLLPQYLVQVKPEGVHGPVEICAYHNQGGQNPRCDTVDTTGQTPEELHEDIAIAINGLGLQLVAMASQYPPTHSHFPEKFMTSVDPEDWWYVRVRNANAKLGSSGSIRVSGLEGQEIVAESDVPGGAVPTLSPWGIAVLSAVLLSGLWFLRRRQRLQQT